MSALLDKIRTIKEAVFALAMELEGLQYEAREELCEDDCNRLEDVALDLDTQADILGEILGDDNNVQLIGYKATRQRRRLRYLSNYLRKRLSPCYKLHRRDTAQRV